MKIGEKIKAIRKGKDYTLKHLADITGLSIGFLSNIERDLNSPSISNLQQICSALGVNLMEVFDEDAGTNPITRAAEREEIFNSNTDASVKVESLLNGKASLNGICITLEKSDTFSDMSWGHGYDEIGIVISGGLEIELDKVIYQLYEGDSIFIKEGTPHRYKNPNNNTSIVYWFSAKK
ncbi:helix-turn-helix domain-containing protein [Fusobacterium hominis]|uniref:helix-turn-helix domain-containing protein n=1 Tax=Fusobacterium hominis TaxID=2764326 RepID=UPI0022E978E1|nr:helix-turn-helix transcriptional regulator [Fusobacterium hominis]